MNIDAFIDEHLVTHSVETERAYRSDLGKFEAFLLGKGLTVDTVRPAHIRAYSQWLSTQRNTRTKVRGLSDDTIKRHMSAVRAYYRWFRFSDPRLQDPTAFFRFRRGRMRRKVLGLPAEIVDRMCTVGSRKEKAIILLLRRSGLRLSELVALNRKAFDAFLAAGDVPAYGRISVCGKGGQERTVYLSRDALEAVRDYLAVRQDKNPALFLGRDGRISKRTVQRIVKRLGTVCGCSDSHVHRLRHTYAVEMLEGGMRVKALRKLMGHDDPVTTLSYVDALDASVELQYEAAMHRTGIGFCG